MAKNFAVGEYIRGIFRCQDLKVRGPVGRCDVPEVGFSEITAVFLNAWLLFAN
jgi:hypothetical protein